MKKLNVGMSPSARKVWIEIRIGFRKITDGSASPSARKVWIEITKGMCFVGEVEVTFRKEGVD